MELPYRGQGEAGPLPVLIERQAAWIWTLRDLLAERGAARRYPGFVPVAANDRLLEDDAAALTDELAAEHR